VRAAVMNVILGVNASRTIHNDMIKTILKAPINLFFEMNPTGSIMNRFSKDLAILDYGMAIMIGFGLNMLYNMISVLVVCVMVNTWFLLVPPILFILSSLLLSYSIAAYRENTRIEAITKSPMLTLLGETINGCPTIRAFGK